MVNVLKQRLDRGENLFGCWIETGSPVIVEILGLQGFDFLVLDLEHGQGDLKDLVDMLRAAKSVGCPCIVRVPWNDPVMLKRVLDSGVDSVMIPCVETAAEAEAAVRACRYPPRGTRGYAASAVRASSYGADPDYMRLAHEQMLIIVQVESAAAAAQAGAIGKVEGVDMVFIGINDMAGSIGLLEQPAPPRGGKGAAQAAGGHPGSAQAVGTGPRGGAGRGAPAGQGHQPPPTGRQCRASAGPASDAA
ncbi:aldolase/citrate lyase family protein, partial [Nostoc sp. NIES-2111]